MVTLSNGCHILDKSSTCGSFHRPPGPSEAVSYKGSRGTQTTLGPQHCQKSKPGNTSCSAWWFPHEFSSSNYLWEQISAGRLRGHRCTSVFLVTCIGYALAPQRQRLSVNERKKRQQQQRWVWCSLFGNLVLRVYFPGHHLAFGPAHISFKTLRLSLLLSDY